MEAFTVESTEHKTPIKLANGSISDDAAAAFDNTDWVGAEYAAILTSSQALAIKAARDYLAATKTAACPPLFVALQAFGVECEALDAIMQDSDDGWWIDGLAYIRVFDDALVLYLEHDSNPQATIKFKIET